MNVKDRELLQIYESDQHIAWKGSSMLKKIFIIMPALVFSLCVGNVYAHSITGRLNASATKCTVKQSVSGSGVITTHIKCYEVSKVSHYYLYRDTSTVYSGGSRTEIFDSVDGYKFVLEHNGVKGTVWVTLGSSTVASASISY